MDRNIIVSRSQPTDRYEVQLKQIGQWALVWRRFRRHRLAVAGLWILLMVGILAIIGPHFAPPLTNETFVQAGDYARPPQLWPLSPARLLGTDDVDEPVSRFVLLGGGPLLIIGFLGALITGVVGTIIGSIAGYFGRFVDATLMRITDAFLTVPFLPFLFLLQFYLPDRSTLTFAVLFGVIGWGGVSRLVRSYVLSLQRREFAEAARALGASDLGIIIRHLLPNSLDIIFVSFTLNVAVFIITDTSLTFLGAGPLDTTWATDMYISPLYFNWWQALFLAIPLVVTVSAINLIGDGLRDAFDTTGAGDLIRWKDRPERAGLRRIHTLLAAPAVPLARRTVSALAVVGVPLGRGRRLLAPIVARRDAVHLPAPLRALDRITNRLEGLPLVLRLVPPLALILASMVVFLLAHSPLRYSRHFTAPVQVAVEEENSEYGAHPLANGAWSLFAVDQSGTLSFSRVSGKGQVRLRQPIASANGSPSALEPAMATGRGWTLGVWVSADESTVMASYLGAHRTVPFALVPAGGLVDHPFVTPTRRGFDILFQWQRNAQQRAEYQVYLAYLPRGAIRPAVIRRIAATPDYGFYPHGVVDGSGDLDVLYLDRFSINSWFWRFQRFTPQGKPVSALKTVGQICYDCLSTESVVPAKWEVDMKRAPDGSVWAVWDGTVGVSDFLYLAHWDRHGRQVLAPTPLPGIGFDAADTSAVSLALIKRGGQLYYTGSNLDGGVGSVTMMLAFDAHGQPVGLPQRVDYQGQGSAANPQAGTVGGKPVVLWARVRAGPTYLEISRYHVRATPPSLLTRLGLNIGNPAINVGLLLVGALAGGIGIAIVNFILLLLLILLWLPIGRLLPRNLAVSAYLTIVAIVTIELFGVHASDPPGWVLLVSGLGSPENWVAVAVSILCCILAAFLLVRRFEPIFRAVAIAFTSVYVIGVMYAVIFIQNEITRI